MAGAGFRTFAAGEVLTASNVNTYLMEQSIMNFAGTAARSSAISSPSEGMFAYLQDTNSLTFYNGSAWVNAGSAIAGTALSSGTATSGQVLTANGSGAVTFSTPTQGLTLIKTYSPSAVSSFSLDANTFSSSYQNYKILINVSAKSATNDIRMRLRASGSDSTGSNYSRAGYFNYTGGTSGGAGESGVTNWGLLAVNSAVPNRTFYSIDLANVNLAVETVGTINSSIQDGSGYRWVSLAILHDASTAYDSATWYPDSGTFSAKVSVYGYNN